MDKREGHGDGSSSRTDVLDVKPLRSLRPMYPAPFGNASVPSSHGAPPFVFISPFPLPSDSKPGQPSNSSSVPFASQPSNTGAANETPRPSDGDDNGNRFCTPLTTGRAPNCDGTPPPTFPGFLSPPPLAVMPPKEDAGTSGGAASSRGRKAKQPDHDGNSKMGASEGETSKSKQKRKRPPKGSELELMALPSSSQDPKELVEVILMTFDALRRRILQIDEAAKAKSQPVMKAGAKMMDYDLRANKAKRVGPVPGIEVGDIFYFRIEMLLVGLHAQSMAGIDCMNTKFGEEDDTIAVSIVSSGGYEDESDLVDSLVYTGQGGKVNEKKQVDDQKLERGNLALERSLQRANEIRVIRGMKDLSFPSGKIFVYDGLYKLHESWVEKGKSGFNVFKYKLLRQAGQPDAFAVWKMTKKWKENPLARGSVILPDMSSGAESIPVCLVNEVDTEKGPAPFSYATKVKYSVGITSTLTLQACSCQNGCNPGDSNCSCALQNGGDLPYSSDGLLISRKPMVYECSSSCLCSGKCRNRLTQKGIKHHFEVFRTRDRGWGLRSWDPIRAGSFICEYVGEVMDKVATEEDDEEDEFVFEASQSNEKAFQWNYGPELLGEPSTANLANTKPLPIIISAKQIGNVARFMNHSCSPNVFWQPVQHDHGDEGYPHIMFFASKHIPPMTELTYDYGLGGRKAKGCLCGSSNCRGSFS